MPFSSRQNLFAEVKFDIEAAFLEYVGTTIFLMLAFGSVQATQSEGTASPPLSQVERVLYIATAFGLSLLITVWLFYRVTGGLFNPDISLALFLTGTIGFLVGGITAAAIVHGLTPGPVAFNTFPGPGVSKAEAVFIEMFITSFLVLAVLMLAKEKHVTTPFAPIGIGLTVFVCHLWAVFFTGAGMNTARSFGPAVITGFPYSTQWIYWLGPFLGSLLSSGFYGLLRMLKYWRLNPGQDSDTMDYPEAPGGEPVQNLMTQRRSQVESRDETAVDGSSPRSSDHARAHGFDGRKYVVQPVTASGAVVVPGAGNPFGERLGDSGSPV
ncbi:transporter [Ganoderma sinense ZZ0214-1]|uniref:Transporter n=1 Tax=Ganoderma sinense ZZ0214-1 TaxID=1077348 RepID=A0A2G8SPG2_9APHY|nr:transporter [Ganoderma sinense ZZ0214-1]